MRVEQGIYAKQVKARNLIDVFVSSPREAAHIIAAENVKW